MLNSIVSYINSKQEKKSKIVNITALTQPQYEPLNNNEFKKLDKIPDKIKLLLGDNDYYHKGVIHKIKIDGSDINVSILSSIITCLIPSYEHRENQQEYLMNFCRILGTDNESINNLANYFYINIFYFDLINNTICSLTTTINPYKINILLLKYNSVYEPLMQCINVAGDVIHRSEPLMHCINVAEQNQIKKYFEQNDACIKNIHPIFPFEIDKLEIKYSALSVNELRDYAKLLNIPLQKNKKYKTKTELLNEINNL